MSDWSYEGLWRKAALYTQKALEEDRDGPMFPFWATLGLEFLGRATLAKVHPALLADPREGDNILHVFGFGTKGDPRSIGAKTVFLRCQSVIPEFTAAETKKAMQLIELRNSELHSGTPAFEGHKSSVWLPDYFRICNLLLNSQDLMLSDLFGEDDSEAATAMIDALEGKVLSLVKQRVADAAKSFDALDEDSKKLAMQGADRRRHTWGFSWRLPRFVDCPACGAPALMQGQPIRESDPRMDEDGIVVDTAALPADLDCVACDLRLSGYSELHAADLGGQYQVSRIYNPLEYYAGEGYFEEDYGND